RVLLGTLAGPSLALGPVVGPFGVDSGSGGWLQGALQSEQAGARRREVMDAKHLLAVERWTLALAALVVGTAILVLSRKAAFSASLGATLMALNVYALRRLAQRAFGSAPKPSAAILLFNL